MKIPFYCTLSEASLKINKNKAATTAAGKQKTNKLKNYFS